MSSIDIVVPHNHSSLCTVFPPIVTAEHGDTVAGLGVLQPGQAVHVLTSGQVALHRHWRRDFPAACTKEVSQQSARVHFFSGDDIDVVVAAAAGTG